MAEKHLVLGLVAHVDAGKTTLSEAMLFAGGQVRKPGRVDHGDAFLDTDVQERERGITIFSKQAEVQWDNLRLTLMDTPGHVDFSSETERTFSVLDAAVLVISGADGVQGHTETLWRLLRAYRIPTVLFINKMDQPGTNRAALTAELKKRLGDGCVDLSAPEGMEEAALCGERAMEAFLESGTVPEEILRDMTGRRQLFPCFFGSALRMKGIDALLAGIRDLVPERTYPEAFGARVYKISRDPQGARLTWMKITGGMLKVKSLTGAAGAEEKVNQIRLYSGMKFRLTEEAPAGTVCAVTGLTGTRAGDGLGAEQGKVSPLLTPVFSWQAIPAPGADPVKTLEQLRQLEEEDPQLQVVWKAEKREIHVQLMGEVQLEILRRLMRDRFGTEISFSRGSILYRETIVSPAEGVGHYEPLRHYAEVHLLLEPGEAGSGLRFESACSTDELDRNWQRLILTHLMEKTHRGVLTGAPVTDMKITLTAGRAHLKHTEGGDFRQATYRAVRQGLMRAESVLLEPWYDLRLELPGDCVGRAMNDLTQMGGRFEPPESFGENAVLTGCAPVAGLRDYPREVNAYTHGQGRVQYSLRGYERCRNQEEVIRAAGYDPLRDPENSPDSVFCAHGAGFVVPWDQVERYMHLHPETGFARGPVPAREAAAPAHSAPAAPAADDEELQAIFERTYGKPKPRTGGALPPLKRNETTVNGTLLEIPEPKTEYLLVDGYNIIFAWPDLKALAEASLEHARKALAELLCNYHGFHPCELILVFDAYRVHGNTGSREEYRGIHIVYTKEAETADNYIEKTIRRIAGKKDSRVRVATSDALEQVIILGGGAERVSAREFRAEVEQAKVEIAGILERNRLRPKEFSPVALAMRKAEERSRQRPEAGDPPPDPAG